MVDSLRELTLLYVEDDAATREGLSRFLKRRAGRVLTAANGEEGLKQYSSNKPDIIVVDLLLPGISGLDMIRRIRRTDNECRVLVTSTVNHLDTIIDAVELKIDFYVLKPVDIVKFEKQINQVAFSIMTGKHAKAAETIFQQPEALGEYENHIKTEFARLLKELSGKGAQKVQVVFRRGAVELRVFGAYNAMELSLLKKDKNTGAVEYSRRLFYETVSGEIETMVREVTGLTVRLSSVEIDGSRQIDNLLLTVVG